MPPTEPKASQDTLTKETQEALTGGDLSQYDSSIPRDAFDAQFANELLQLSRGKLRSRVNIFARNRKHRGITSKEETIASLRIISNLAADSRKVQKRKIVGGGFKIFGTDQFVLQNATEQDSERFQIVETFGEPVAFFFGRKPRIYNYSGFLYNSGFRFTEAGERDPFTFAGVSVSNQLWRDNFKLAYELFLRGTKCVRFRARAYLNYDRVLREGFILNNQISQSVYPNMVNFSFNMFITREVNLDSIDALRKNTDRGLDPASPNDATIKAIRQKTLSAEEVAKEKRR